MAGKIYCIFSAPAIDNALFFGKVAVSVTDRPDPATVKDNLTPMAIIGVLYHEDCKI
jgi:hypothetical protein